MFEQINYLLRSCTNWNKKLKNCMLRLEHKKHPMVVLKDLPFNCKGYGNPSYCVWYKYYIQTDKQMKKERQELRRKRP